MLPKYKSKPLLMIIVGPSRPIQPREDDARHSRHGLLPLLDHIPHMSGPSRLHTFLPDAQRHMLAQSRLPGFNMDSDTRCHAGGLRNLRIPGIYPQCVDG